MFLHLRASFPTTDAAERLVDGQAFDEGAGGGYAEHDLADESPGERAPILGRTTGTAGGRGNEGLQADSVENDDEASQHFSQRVDFLAQPWEQGRLNVVPARPHGDERVDVVHSEGVSQIDNQ
jgi:hypothetical protein